ncbi:MBL fold metallo-hydrolase [Streptomyces sp. HU2014]|uniref:MBL fold metallo-hydrolase n=1 Tax=Streptomyces sp. HU2014 TaxID=2939414 RepID=UPI00200EB583|nr:MBL fold metallo-hydrolase [Streptomyces sp. HU2014]UQI47056.1 MBL fold metallo-hydrolase [Streptomyces sp. HU2014]
MRVRHLNFGTYRPPSQKLINGHGSLFRAGHLVCHCLLLETDAGLVLVDTGFGTKDAADPLGRLGRAFMLRSRPVLRPEEAAVSQLAALGHDPRDVRHIVLTHLDRDHTGGLADFPEAQVHVYGPEFRAAMDPRTKLERARYRPTQWEHGPHWIVHELADGEKWFGFECVRQITGLPPEILLVPLLGHTRGHIGVAVDTGTGLLLHAGDAYMFHGEMENPPYCSPGLRAFQKKFEVLPQRLTNVARLRELRRTTDVEVFSAHDLIEFEGWQKRNG